MNKQQREAELDTENKQVVARGEDGAGEERNTCGTNFQLQNK